MNNSNNGTGAGIIVDGILGTAFVVLKLVGVIDWSWWWVTAPFWGTPAILLIIVVIASIAKII